MRAKQTAASTYNFVGSSLPQPKNYTSPASSSSRSGSAVASQPTPSSQGANWVSANTTKKSSRNKGGIVAAIITSAAIIAFVILSVLYTEGMLLGTPQRNDYINGDINGYMEISESNISRLGIGLNTRDVDSGVIIDGFIAGSDAPLSGMLIGDIIVNIDGHAIRRQSDITDSLSDYQAGDVVDIRVLRGNSERAFQVRVGHFDSNGVFHPPPDEPFNSYDNDGYVYIGNARFSVDLTSLNLSGWNLQNADIDALRQMTRLTELHLDDNQITHVAPLSGLTNLEVLGLANNQIVNIAPLSRLRNLRSVTLNGNPIANWSAVGHVENVWGRPQVDYEENGYDDNRPPRKLTPLIHFHN